MEAQTPKATRKPHRTMYATGAHDLPRARCLCLNMKCETTTQLQESCRPGYGGGTAGGIKQKPCEWRLGTNVRHATE